MQNDGVENQEYVNILNQLIEPVLPFLSPEMNGLDYGCSSEPALSILLKKRGLKCQDYNPGNSTLIENETFDYIFVNNCLSEFFLPAKELQKINNLLKPDGYLIIANEKWTTPEAFTRLSHAKDNTHVTFYHTNTFRYIAEKYKLSIIESNNPRIVLMKKGKSDIELKDVKPKSELELV